MRQRLRRATSASSGSSSGLRRGSGSASKSKSTRSRSNSMSSSTPISRASCGTRRLRRIGSSAYPAWSNTVDCSWMLGEEVRGCWGARAESLGRGGPRHVWLSSRGRYEGSRGAVHHRILRWQTRSNLSREDQGRSHGACAGRPWVSLGSHLQADRLRSDVRRDGAGGETRDFTRRESVGPFFPIPGGGFPPSSYDVTRAVPEKEKVRF